MLILQSMFARTHEPFRVALSTLRQPDQKSTYRTRARAPPSGARSSYRTHCVALRWRLRLLPAKMAADPAQQPVTVTEFLSVRKPTLQCSRRCCPAHTAARVAVQPVAKPRCARDAAAASRLAGWAWFSTPYPSAAHALCGGPLAARSQPSPWLLTFVSTASGAGRGGQRHQLHNSDDGERRVHLRARAGAGGHLRHGQPERTASPPNHRGQRADEPGGQGARAPVPSRGNAAKLTLKPTPRLPR
jgi:hypothetical protein